MDFLIGVTVLLSYQLLGEALVLLLELPVPGPVMGMLLLFLTLLVRKRTGQALDSAAGFRKLNSSSLWAATLSS